LLGRLRQEMGLAPDAIGLIGGPPASGALQPGDRLERDLLALEGIRDLRGRLRLPQLVGALRRSRLCLAVDSGPLHLAAAAGCPTVALFGTDSAGIGASPRDLWAPRTANVWLSSSRLGCSGCLEERFANPACRREEHLCMQGLEPAAVWPLVRQAWDHPARRTGADSLIAA
jgi:ADP-heptose:LPS heptosyltransferase